MTDIGKDLVEISISLSSAEALQKIAINISLGDKDTIK